MSEGYANTRDAAVRRKIHNNLLHTNVDPADVILKRNQDEARKQSWWSLSGPSAEVSPRKMKVLILLKVTLNLDFHHKMDPPLVSVNGFLSLPC